MKKNFRIQLTRICILLVCVLVWGFRFVFKKKKDSKAVVVRSMNKTNVDFCLTGFLQPRAHLSKGLSRLIFLHPSYFPLVSFQSHLFLLSSFLSSLIPSPFLLLSENHFYPTVSFHSSASGLNCPPLLCHSTPVLKPGWNSRWAQGNGTTRETTALESLVPNLPSSAVMTRKDKMQVRLFRFTLDNKPMRLYLLLAYEKYSMLIVKVQTATHIFTAFCK